MIDTSTLKQCKKDKHGVMGMLSKDIYLELFNQMLRIRNIELKIAELYSEWEMRCPVHLSIGQEAVASGVCSALESKDNVFCGHRSHAYYLAKGGDLKGMLAEIYGKATGIVEGMGGSQHLIDLDAGLIAAVPIVGSTIPIAVGSAWGDLMQNNGVISAAFFGEGATEAGVFHESLNFAALQKVPIIFVCENNGFSVYSNLEVRQSSKRNNVTIAEGHGLNTLKGDGNDILEVYDLTKKAIELIKQGKGPVYMEFDTYRWLEHCGPSNDDYLGYRDEKEVKEWKERCPLKNYQDFLIDEKLINQDEIQDMTSKLDKEIEEAVQFAKSSPFSKKELLFSTVYSN